MRSSFVALAALCLCGMAASATASDRANLSISGGKGRKLILVMGTITQLAAPNFTLHVAHGKQPQDIVFATDQTTVYLIGKTRASFSNLTVNMTVQVLGTEKRDGSDALAARVSNRPTK